LGDPGWPAADCADGADGAEEATSSALPVGASRSAVAVWVRPAAAALTATEARKALRVGSVPPEIGIGRCGMARPSPTPSVPIKAASA
jgi:hypothetical protein